MLKKLVNFLRVRAEINYDGHIDCQPAPGPFARTRPMPPWELGSH